MTTKLYQNDVYLREWDATVLSAWPDTGFHRIVLDKSAFFPEGGGQSCDTGVIAGLKVIDVQEEDGLVVHSVSPGPDDVIPSPGDSVHCSIDWDRRFENMQRHCGEHILSGIFYARCGGVNRGFHMGSDYMTIDISLEEDPSDSDALRPDTIDMDIALDCERRANQVIWSDAPVTVLLFDERNDVKDMPLRKALAFDEDISIVCVGSPDNVADCVACCGTHPSSAGQVGLIKIYKVENYKGMFRIYFDAGRRALWDYEKKHAILSGLANAHSSSIDDLADALKAQEDRLSDTKNSLHHIKSALIRREQESLDALISGKESGSRENEDASVSPIIMSNLDDLSIDDAFELAKPYMGKVKKLLMLYVTEACSFVLVSSGDPHCGNLVKEYASYYKGKGGGSDTSARAIFSSEEDAMLFADLIGKHLK